MTPSDSDAKEYVQEKPDRLVACAMASKVRGTVSDWEAERTGKAAVVRGALLGLSLLLGVSVLSGLLAPLAGGFVLLGGFLAWAVFVGVLIWRNLGARRR